MHDIHVDDFAALREHWRNFASLPATQRVNWWFRGQCNATYRLIPTVDRDRSFADDNDREMYIERLLTGFRSEVVDLSLGQQIPFDPSFELLARHHGLPSPWLDWTRSPWVATFFAFETARPDQELAIYCLDRSRVVEPAPRMGSKRREAIELRDEPELISGNPRAIRQRGVFLRVSTISNNVEALLSPALSRLIVPAGQRDQALAEMDLMLLNATNLRYDLEAAARTTVWRNV